MDYMFINDIFNGHLSSLYQSLNIISIVKLKDCKISTIRVRCLRCVVRFGVRKKRRSAQKYCQGMTWLLLPYSSAIGHDSEFISILIAELENLGTWIVSAHSIQDCFCRVNWGISPLVMI
jgi:hypothetical protein